MQQLVHQETPVLHVVGQFYFFRLWQTCSLHYSPTPSVLLNVPPQVEACAASISAYSVFILDITPEQLLWSSKLWLSELHC